MQHGDHRAAFLVPSHDLIEQHRSRLRIDRGERLVEQNDRGVLQDQPREQRPLQFADRQLADPTAPAVAANPTVSAAAAARARSAALGSAEGAELPPAAER